MWRGERCLKLPTLIHRLDSPFELVAESLRKELLDRNAELLREDDGKAGIDIVLTPR